MVKTVSKKTLVRELNLSIRRVEQLIKAGILPDCGENQFDLDLCRELYWLYSKPEDARGWSGFQKRLEEDAGEAEKLCEIALKPKATFAEVVVAARASVRERVRFLVASTGDPGKASHEMMMRLVDYDEQALCGPVVQKLMRFKQSDAQAFLAAEAAADKAG